VGSGPLSNDAGVINAERLGRSPVGAAAGHRGFEVGCWALLSDCPAIGVVGHVRTPYVAALFLLIPAAEMIP
jgi:hypothetical protein